MGLQVSHQSIAVAHTRTQASSPAPLLTCALQCNLCVFISRTPTRWWTNNPIATSTDCVTRHTTYSNFFSRLQQSSRLQHRHRHLGLSLHLLNEWTLHKNWILWKTNFLVIITRATCWLFRSQDTVEGELETKCDAMKRDNRHWDGLGKEEFIIYFFSYS